MLKLFCGCIIFWFFFLTLNAGVTDEKRPLIFREFFGVAKGSKIEMFLDNQNITNRCRVTESRIEYSPQENLSVGMHDVTVVVTTPKGRIHKIDWVFEIDPTVKRLRPSVKFLPPSPRNGSHQLPRNDCQIHFEIDSANAIDKKSLQVLVLQNQRLVHRLTETLVIRNIERSFGDKKKIVVRTPQFPIGEGITTIKVIAQDIEENSVSDEWLSFTVADKKNVITDLKIVAIDRKNRKGLRVSGLARARLIDVVIKGNRRSYDISLPVNSGKFDHFIDSQHLPKVRNSWEIIAKTKSNIASERVFCPEHWPQKISGIRQETTLAAIAEGLEKGANQRGTGLKNLKKIVQPGPYLVQGTAGLNTEILISIEGRVLKKLTSDAQGKYRQWIALEREGDYRGVVREGDGARSWTFGVLVDATAPIVRAQGMSHKARFKDNRQKLRFHVDENLSGWETSGVRLALNGRTWKPRVKKSGGNLAVDLVDLLEAGSHEIEVSISDLAGNRSLPYKLSFDIEKLVRGKGARLLAQQRDLEAHLEEIAIVDRNDERQDSDESAGDERRQKRKKEKKDKRNKEDKRNKRDKN